MSTIISTKTSGVGGLSVTGDASGILQLASADGTTALTIDASQNVGIGTSSPTVKLNVIGTGLFGTNGGNSTYFNPFTATTSSVQAHSSGGNSGSVVATEYSASGGAGPGFYAGRSASGTLGTQTACPSGMQLGSFGAYGSDGTKFLQCAYISAIAQSSFTTNNGATYLSFGTNGGSASVTERMRIDSSGNLLVGTTSVINGSNAILQASNVNGGRPGINVGNSAGSSATNCIIFTNSNGTVGTIQTSGTATSYVTSSDYRLKENIAPMVGALNTVAQLKPVIYKWKANGSDGQGFIAHELQVVVPDAVAGEKDAVAKDGSIIPQGIDPSKLVATLTAAIQELKAIIDTQTARIEALEAKI